MDFDFVLYWSAVWLVCIINGDQEASTVNDLKCKNNICLNATLSKDFESSETVFDRNYDINLAEKNLTLQDRNIYNTASSEKPLAASTNQNGFTYIFLEEKEKTTVAELKESSINKFDSINETNGTAVTEISETDILTVEPNISVKFTSYPKANSPTTESPTKLQKFFLKTLSNNICFCDLTLNECDMNCCCDGDCTISHLKAFTKCIESDTKYDINYCYKTNFLFKNNSFYEVIQNDGGLFCIVKDNAKLGFNYETKPPITTLELFNKSVPCDSFFFSYKTFMKAKFNNKNYVVGSDVWTLQNGEAALFKVPFSSFGFLCDSETSLKYLVEDKRFCYYELQSHNICGSKMVENVLLYIRNIKVVLNPDLFNITNKNEVKMCKPNICTGISIFICHSNNNEDSCRKISENFKDSLQINCSNVLSQIQYLIWHNGSEGIVKVNAYFWFKQKQRTSNNSLSQLVTEVKYTWINSTKKIFHKSGNPGYLTGKPILAGHKIYYFLNGTSDKKEAIELSYDPKNWLSVLGSVKGICSPKARIPIGFRENSQHMCSLKLNKSNFNKEKCVELQNNIFNLLIESDVINQTKENGFNKFVATFGNSKVEETGDWVQVLIDSFPVLSNQVTFKMNYYNLICKNIITDLYVDIIYSNIGSVLAPQAKILGVYYRFGKHKDLTYNCDSFNCENTTVAQDFKLTSSVRFVDITKPALDAFAEPLSLEVKLPHDFFYPFFSKGYKERFLNKYVLSVFIFIFL